MTRQYFAIYSLESGVRIEKVEDIHKFLEESVEYNRNFAEDFPEDRWFKNKNAIHMENPLGDEEVLLIYGEIVVPKKKEVVTEYVIDRVD